MSPNRPRGDRSRNRSRTTLRCVEIGEIVPCQSDLVDEALNLLIGAMLGLSPEIPLLAHGRAFSSFDGPHTRASRVVIPRTTV